MINWDKVEKDINKITISKITYGGETIDKMTNYVKSLIKKEHKLIRDILIKHIKKSLIT